MQDQNSMGAEPDLTSIPAETMKLLTGAAVDTPFSCGTSTQEDDTPFESLFAQPAANTAFAHIDATLMNAPQQQSETSTSLPKAKPRKSKVVKAPVESNPFADPPAAAASAAVISEDAAVNLVTPNKHTWGGAPSERSSADGPYTGTTPVRAVPSRLSHGEAWADADTDTADRDPYQAGTE